MTPRPRRNRRHAALKSSRSAVALSLPFAKPTHYGLGRSGWVTASFGRREKPPVDMLRAWIGESYGSIAPKKPAALASEKPQRRPMRTLR